MCALEAVEVVAKAAVRLRAEGWGPQILSAGGKWRCLFCGGLGDYLSAPNEHTADCPWQALMLAVDALRPPADGDEPFPGARQLTRDWGITS